MNERLRVAVFVNSTSTRECSFFDGVARFAQSHDWHIVTGGEVLRCSRSSFIRWPGQGVVGFVRDPEFALALKRARIPTVNTSQEGLEFGFPNVVPSFEEAGRMAAQFFLERGFRHYAFSYVGSHPVKKRKFHGFSSRLAEVGLSCTVIGQHEALPKNRTWAQCQKDLIAQLRRLPKPLAIWATADQTAVSILEACEVAGIRVPEEIAVMGLGNERTICRYARPELASIDPNFEGVGFLAAGVLEELMAGGPRPSDLTLTPWTLIERGSAETMCKSDPQLVQALSYIEAHACDPIWVEDVFHHVGMSRRQLERLFRQHFFRSPNSEIVRIRILRARQLLRETSMSFGEIAAACGFSGACGLRLAFKRLTGVSPRTYRSQAL
ncbi:substrate-binding domain-containing protein [Candidatus Sumerlaeota bacterium]|nr:substrate-binding domain-containing protein [Candidatus Sumerlaeota bacterium]